MKKVDIEIGIHDNENILNFFPAFIQKLFNKTYYNQGFVYIEKHLLDDKPTFCSDTIRWLEKLKIKTYSQKRADKLSWEYFNKKYPEYEHYIQLF